MLRTNIPKVLRNRRPVADSYGDYFEDGRRISYVTMGSFVTNHLFSVDKDIPTNVGIELWSFATKIKPPYSFELLEEISTTKWPNLMHGVAVHLGYGLMCGIGINSGKVRIFECQNTSRHHFKDHPPSNTQVVICIEILKLIYERKYNLQGIFETPRDFFVSGEVIEQIRRPAPGFSEEEEEYDF